MNLPIPILAGMALCSLVSLASFILHLVTSRMLKTRIMYRDTIFSMMLVTGMCFMIASVGSAYCAGLAQMPWLLCWTVITFIFGFGWFLTMVYETFNREPEGG